MTWTAPAVDRPTEPERRPRATRPPRGCSTYHRATLLWKCAGLTGEQLATRAVPPSSMSTARAGAPHGRRASGPGSGGGWPPSRSTASYWSERQPGRRLRRPRPGRGRGRLRDLRRRGRGRQEGAGEPATSTTHFERAARQRTSETIDIRALVVHMIEEYARHNGHADLLREVVDGSTGDSPPHDALACRRSCRRVLRCRLDPDRWSPCRARTAHLSSALSEPRQGRVLRATSAGCRSTAATGLRWAAHYRDLKAPR